uniref:CUB domain-containing protein n=1 Tax=Romanomermis culicivorax TaxID=13658 RepID=A0A915IGW4_ROMCU
MISAKRNGALICPFGQRMRRLILMHSGVQKVVKSTIDHATMTLDVFPNNVDPEEFCLLTYVKQFDTSKYTAVKCASPSQKIDNLPDQISNVKVRFCRIRSMDCGESYEILVDDPSSVAAMSWVTALIIVGSIIFLVLVIFVIFLMRPRCYRRFKSTESCEKKKYLSSTSYKKDYEFDNSQCRSKIISGPYLTKETPGPPSAFGSLEKRTLTTGSKDSGVFTTYGSSVVNNQADPSGRFSMDHTDTKQYLSSTVRRPSYEAETGNWHPNEVR